MGTAATPSASGSAPPSWEALPDSARRIYLALADGDEDQARQLLKADRQAAATRRVRSRSRRRRADPRSSATRRDRQASRPAPEADPGHVRDRETNSRQAETKGKTRAKTKAKTATGTGTGTGRGTAGGGSATHTTGTLDLRGFVERHKGHYEPPEMRAAEAWKRRMARS
jgi:hypothetical protein